MDTYITIKKSRNNRILRATLVIFISFYDAPSSLKVFKYIFRKITISVNQRIKREFYTLIPVIINRLQIFQRNSLRNFSVGNPGQRRSADSTVLRKLSHRSTRSLCPRNQLS